MQPLPLYFYRCCNRLGIQRRRLYRTCPISIKCIPAGTNMWLFLFREPFRCGKADWRLLQLCWHADGSLMLPQNFNSRFLDLGSECCSHYWKFIFCDWAKKNYWHCSLKKIFYEIFLSYLFISVKLRFVVSLWNCKPNKSAIHLHVWLLNCCYLLSNCNFEHFHYLPVMKRPNEFRPSFAQN